MENIQIQLHGKNPESANSLALISPKHAPQILDYKWYLGKNGYPYTFINGGRVPLHRYVWYLKTGNWYNDSLFVDHINRNKLDATNENLRLATPAENSYNKTPATTKNTILDPISEKPLHHIKFTKTGYEVSLSKEGLFNKIDKIASLEEAKEIYNMMATEMFGNFAVLY